jgi:hypothetical protein
MKFKSSAVVEIQTVPEYLVRFAEELRLHPIVQGWQDAENGWNSSE